MATTGCSITAGASTIKPAKKKTKPKSPVPNKKLPPTSLKLDNQNRNNNKNGNAKPNAHSNTKPKPKPKPNSPQKSVPNSSPKPNGNSLAKATPMKKSDIDLDDNDNDNDYITNHDIYKDGNSNIEYKPTIKPNKNKRRVKDNPAQFSIAHKLIQQQQAEELRKQMAQNEEEELKQQAAIQSAVPLQAASPIKKK